VSIRRLVHVHFALMWAATSAGCSSEGADAGEAYTVRDSAGIEIVENHTPQWSVGDEWVLSDSATLQLGEVDGPAELTFSVPVATELSDGRILVSDSGSEEIRYFSSRGHHLLTVGGEGPGPGEFMSLGSTFVLPGDTVVATDRSSGRVSVYDESGQLVGSVKLEVRASPTSVTGPLSTWRWAATSTFLAADSAGLSGRLQEIIIYGRDGSIEVVVDTLTQFRMVTQQMGGRVAYVSLPFGPRPSLTAGSGQLFVTRGDQYEVRQYDGNGRLQRIIRRDWAPEPVTGADIAAHMEQVEEQFERFSFPTAQRSVARERNEEAARRSSVKPAIRAIALSKSGHLWVLPWSLRWDSTAAYDVFQPDGRWLGSVTVPEGHWLTDIGPDYAWATWADEMGVNYVRRLHIQVQDD